MSDTAWVITIVYAAFTIVGVAIVLYVFRSTRVGFRARPAGRSVLEGRETLWTVAVVVLLVSTLLLTMSEIPYGSDSKADAPQKIEITGRQFAWTVDPPRVRAHVKTAVELHAVDVSHAIGVYDPDGKLLKQVNVLPGVTQRFVITFDKLGPHKLRCMEFCGVDHHLMQTDLVVTR